jgi:hypothetical protein
MFQWVNDYSSGSVDFRIIGTLRYYLIGFEDTNDALVFRIKYGV